MTHCNEVTIVKEMIQFLDEETEESQRFRKRRITPTRCDVAETKETPREMAFSCVMH